jgi:hypothetical protein
MQQGLGDGVPDPRVGVVQASKHRFDRSDIRRFPHDPRGRGMYAALGTFEAGDEQLDGLGTTRLS